VEARPSGACLITDHVSRKIRNDYSFPLASTIRFKFAAREDMGPLDLYWYDGGMRPPTPEELEADNKELEAEGMMFVGDKGKILAGFLIEDPRIIPEKKMREYQGPKPAFEAKTRDPLRGPTEFAAACRGVQPSPADFAHAGPISEAFNLAAAALRAGRRLEYDAASMKITNVPDANKYLVREYRKGWEL
jgi:hypothetical protein